MHADEVAVDARAELDRRLEDLGHNVRVLVARAYALASARAYLADLRPFAEWVVTAREHKNRAGQPPQPPAYRSSVIELLAAVGLPFDLGAAVEQACSDAIAHGVDSRQFHESSAFVEQAWQRLTVDFNFMGTSPRHREGDHLRNGLCYALRTFLPNVEFGGTLVALVLAATQDDKPIRRHRQETVADAVARRAKRYHRRCSVATRHVSTADERFMSVDGVDGVLELDDDARVETGLYLGDGRVVLRRPGDVPTNARAVIRKRGARRYVYARWRASGKTNWRKLARIRSGSHAGPGRVKSKP